MEYPGTAQRFKVPRIISGTGKATDFKFGRYIHSVHANKSPLKILEKKRSWAFPGTAQSLSTLYYLRNGLSYELQILYALSQGQSKQKRIKNFRKSSRGRTQGHSRFFWAPVRRVHRAVIFAVSSAFLLVYCNAARSTIGYRHNNVIYLSVRLSVCDVPCIAAKRYILQQVSEQVNRKCPQGT